MSEITKVITVEVEFEVIVTLEVEEETYMYGEDADGRRGEERTDITDAKLINWELNENIGLTAVVDREIKKYNPMDWV
jgi:hypothetical protein